MDERSELPVIDIAALVGGQGNRRQVAAQIDRACRQWGFFYITNHGVSAALERQLEEQSRLFFSRASADKLKIAMVRGGRAWRGYFDVGGELTSGVPDCKEGLYFGQELPEDHPLVHSGTPLHGANLFPDGMPLFRSAVLEYITALSELGHALMAGIALGLGLDETYFARHCTGEPLVLFRIFNYPPAPPDDHSWGVGEHTDYGLLTILKQDDTGGLQVKSEAGGWQPVAPIPGTFVCNIGDMLECMSGGLYRSTPHRVLNRSGQARLSFPFFFDPGFYARVGPIAGLAATPSDGHERWDGASVHDWQGIYGDYVLAKVGRVFPQLQQAVL
ncbi:isopenicillin N synthase family dioxygenase [Gloeobacter kilaueensis]|uniref:2OG-Fe(II) oxygenase n=1 Tax=Gloeobacter kilaueensis (strain ATCC BAA-2537 / CCAP 1431/1 / ULC 316 / JS1) TaxID=1183438 RepID=U5QFL8_GLOK1|nr:2-oxoglutarate and iron-dependent oxygenase domain-containing protein [Gloeobacter kilaueensis]AGY57762.1 2OG-Fe(II) oxygenase [Gloeobacter kilaueensis JS1]